MHLLFSLAAQIRGGTGALARWSGALLLSMSLALSAAADPPAYVLHSPDGKSHCSVWCWEGETVKVTTEKRGEEYEWERTVPNEAFLAVSPAGQVLVTVPGQLRLYQADSSPVRTIQIQFRPEAGWYSLDGKSIFVLEGDRVWQSNPLDWQPKLAPWEQIWDSPGAPLPELLWTAFRQNQLPTRERLLALAESSNHSLRVTALGCLARQGDAQAIEKLRGDLPPKYAYGDAWLTAMAIAGLDGWETQFANWCLRGQAPDQKVFDRFGPPGQRWLAQQLQGQAKDELAFSLCRYQHPLDLSTIERLERLVKADDMRALLALRDADYPQRDEVLTRLLKTFKLPPELLKGYFLEHSVPDSGPYWLEQLRQHPHSKDLPKILQSTYRVDLGSDPKVWQAWLTQRSQDAGERLGRLSDKDPARLLLQGWLGRLDPKELNGRLRVVQLLDEPAHVLDCQWLETLSGHHQLIPLGPGKPVMLGPEKVAVERTSGRQAWLTSSGIELRGLNGSRQPKIEGEFSADSIFQFFGRGRWLVADNDLIDLSTGERKKLPGDASHLFLDGQSGPEYMYARHPIWNLQKGSEIPELSPVLACDGRGYILQGRHDLIAYDLDGKELGRLDGSVFEALEVGPGASWAMVTRYERKIGAKEFPPLLWIPGKEPQPIPSLGKHRAATALSPDGARMHRVDFQAREEELYELPQFKRVAHWPWRGSWAQFSSDHRYLCVSQKRETLVYELDRTPPEVPPEGQRLFTELWTGTRLQRGLAVDLTPAEYQSRRQQWAEEAGSDWGLNPVWMDRTEDWPWWWSLPGVVGLLVGLFFITRASKEPIRRAGES